MQWILWNEPDAVHRRAYLFLVDSVDGITPELGEAGGQPQISQNGGGFVNTTNTLVTVGNGAYYVQLEQLEVNTRGNMLVRYKSVNTCEFQALLEISIRGVRTGYENY